MTAGSWVLAVAFAAQAVAYPPAFPRQNATKLLETDRIVVWDIVWPKGRPSPLHRHVYDQVGTYYQPGGRVITQADGTKSEAVTPLGNISTTRKGTTHIEEGATDPPLRAVFVELKWDMQGSELLDVAPRPGARQVHVEPRVTIWDFTWSPTTPPLIRYNRETLVVWLTPGTFRIKKDAQSPELVSVKPGSYWYRENGTVETEELTEGSPRAILFEFR